MSQQLLSLLDQYICAAQAALDSSKGFEGRNDYLERLSSAQEMRDALLENNLARAASILSSEERSIGWGGLHDSGGDIAHELFMNFSKKLLSLRLANRPDAGFGH